MVGFKTYSAGLTIGLSIVVSGGCGHSRPQDEIPTDADVEIRGQVVDSSGQAIADIMVAWVNVGHGPPFYMLPDSFRSSGGNLEVTLESFQDIASLSHRVAFSRTDSQGRFEFNLTGYDVTAPSQTDCDYLPARVATGNQLAILQEPGATDGHAAILYYNKESEYDLSITHRFGGDAELVWDAGTVALWNSASQVVGDGRLEFAWPELADSEAYHFRIHDSEGRVTWSHLSDSRTFSLPVEALHTSHSETTFAVWSENSRWLYRSAFSSIDMSNLERREDVLRSGPWRASMTGFFDASTDNIVTSDDPPLFVDGNLETFGDIPFRNGPSNRARIIFDLGPDGTLKDISTVVLHDLYTYFSCIYLEVWEGYVGEFGAAGMGGPSATTTHCTADDGALWHQWVVLQFDTVRATRYLDVEWDMVPNAIDVGIAAEVAEVGIY